MSPRADGDAARPHPESGFGPWVWGVIFLVCASCAGLVFFQARQAGRNERSYEAVRLLRQARLDLTEGFLHLAEADHPGSPFSRTHGLALIRQATERLNSDFAGAEPDASKALVAVAARLSETLSDWPTAGLTDAGYAAELRARFLAVEREADASDRVLRERLQEASVARRGEFAAVALAATALVLLCCCALLLLRRRGVLAARAARESAERFAVVVQNIREGLVLIEADGGRTRWNPAALALHGVAIDENVERSLAELSTLFALRTTDGAPVEPADWPAARVLRGETLVDVEFRVCRVTDGVERIFSYGGAPIRDGRGAGFGFVTIRDVTARREAERELRELNAELERRVADRTAALEAKNRELETFTYSVSHDLKAPLRGIDGYSSLLLMEHADRLNEEGREFLCRVRQASNQMGRLIDDLLAYSRLDRLSPQVGSVSLTDAVREQLHVLSSQVETLGAHVTVDVATDIMVRADPRALSMVLRNLIDNALKFARPGQPPEIEISARVAPEGGVAFFVRDRGIGFDTRHAERIFEIFQRLHRAEDFPGTGVGLAIVKRAMERMDGRVWAKSTEGEGATFNLWLPAPNAES